MKKTRLTNVLLGGFLLLLASGCASPIAENLRKEAMAGGTFPMVFENPDDYQGNTVVWGGSIIRTINTKEGSQVYILQTQLDSRDKPESTDTSEGRFIAISDHRLDPLVYIKGRLITVAGQVAGKKVVTHKKSGATYTYPMVRAEQLYLWPKQEESSTPYYGPAYDPYWWGGYDPFWDYPYFGGYYGDEGWGGGGEGREGRGDEDHDRDRR